MEEYEGEERRNEKNELFHLARRIHDIEKTIIEREIIIQESIIAQDKVHISVTNDIGEIKDTLKKYLPMWEAAATSARANRTMHQAVVEKSVIGVVWGALLLIGLSVWNYVKHLLAITPPPS